MPNFSVVAWRIDSNCDWVTNHLQRRIWPIAVSVVYVGLGMAYFFRWGSVVQHVPSAWTMPYDLAYTYLATSQLAHGHLGAIYNAHVSYDEFPGIVIAMAPLGSLSNVFHTTLLQVVNGHSYVVSHYTAHYTYIPFLTQDGSLSGASCLSRIPNGLWPLASTRCCCRVGIVCLRCPRRRTPDIWGRRAVLSVVEAVLLWNVIVEWGHPEDAVAIALSMYALIFAFKRRFVGAGWLFGAAVAFQPLVLLMLPVLLAIAGRRNGLGLAIRSILPSAVLVAVPLIANFSTTFHALAEQPNYPNRDHATPWTALSPRLGGHGLDLAVAGGPGRVVAILLAALIGVWVYKRWRERPDLVVFACVVVFALRSYTESVLDAYYPWAALAVGVVVAARCSRWRFATAISLAIAATIVAQWNLAWLPWWTVQIVCLTALLVVAAQQPVPSLPKDSLPLKGPQSTGPVGTLIHRVLGNRQDTPGPPPKEADRGTRRPKSPAVAQGRSGSGTTKKKRSAPPPATKRSGR